MVIHIAVLQNVNQSNKRDYRQHLRLRSAPRVKERNSKD